MLGADVVGYSLDPVHEKGIFQISSIGSLIADYRADIRNLQKLCQVFDIEKPEIVFHLAAQPLVLESYKSPVETFEVNIQGTVNILEAIRRSTSVKAAVFITTDKCYENKEWLWGYRENDAMGGNDPYSASKAAAEIVINSYRKSFFAKEGSAGIASARAGNVIGGGDWSENRLVPDIIKAFDENKLIEIRNPFSTRPWQHVLDPLSGYLKLAASLLNSPKEFSEAWNFGPFSHSNYTVKQVVESIIRYYGKGSWLDLSNSGQLHEANLLMLDISKAVQKLNWNPTLTFEESISYTVDWYSHAMEDDMLSFSQSQIRQFKDKWIIKNGN
jgi:CDP-glucose 4,6-dehydratase